MGADRIQTRDSGLKRFIASIVLISIGWSAASYVSPVEARRTARDHPQTELPSDQNFRKGKERYNSGDYDGAIDSFLQSVYFARNNYQPVANLWLGKAYMMKHEDFKAIDSFKKAIEQSLSGNVEAHVLLGEVYLRCSRDEEAMTQASYALSDAEGRCPEGHNLMGKVNIFRENYGGAIGDFENALGDKPWTYTEAWMNLAECMMKVKNYVGALQQFKGMIDSYKKLVGINYQQIHLDIGLCLLAKGDHQGAIDNWHETLDYNVGNAEAHLQLAMIYDAENHIQSSIDEYKQYIRYSSDANKVQRAKMRIQLLEQKLIPTEAPTAPRPSPYMRQQMEEQQRQVEHRQQQQQPTQKESGF
jgi:tetratricopeptide (TPR) repeat protein